MFKSRLVFWYSVSDEVRVCGRKYFRLFSSYFVINILRMCLRHQIFRVLLVHFISEVVRKWQRNQMFLVLLVHLLINFVTKWLRFQWTTTTFWAGVSYHWFLWKSCCGSNCYISFSVFYHWCCAQMTARAVMISQVTASGSGIAFVLFFH